MSDACSFMRFSIYKMRCDEMKRGFTAISQVCTEIHTTIVNVINYNDV